MELEVLLSVMNLNKKDLDKMNITSKCTIINQTDIEDVEEYKNYMIYSCTDTGLSNSRNRGLEKIKSDIVILCDDDVVYNDYYEQIILNEFKKNPKADVILFNLYSPNRKRKVIEENKRLRKYNTFGYGSQSIAFRRKSILRKGIVFHQLFGAGSVYTTGEDTLFIVDCLKKNLKIYCCTKYIGTVNHEHSTWFKGYNKKYFFNKGALYTAISTRFRKPLMKQYLKRHPEVLTRLDYHEAYKYMKMGSNDYLERIYKKKY